jgi:hypothetical protein
VKLAIPVVFGRLGLDFDKFSRGQLDHNITETNILDYFEEIEQQASRLFSVDLEKTQMTASDRKDKDKGMTGSLASQQEFNSALDKLGEEFEASKGLMFKKEVDSRGQDRFLDREDLIRELADMKQSASKKKPRAK